MFDSKCSSHVLNAIVSVFSTGMSVASVSDLQDVIVALRTWQPNGVLVDVCEARLLIQERNWRDAAQLLRHVTDKHHDLPIVLSLHALCLYMMRDDAWRERARETVSSGNHIAISIVARFLNLYANLESESMTSADSADKILIMLDTHQALEYF